MWIGSPFFKQSASQYGSIAPQQVDFQWSQFVFNFSLYYHLQLLLSPPPNGATPVRNYVIHLFYPCKSNQLAVEQPGCIWLRVALGCTVMCLTIILTGQALLTWEAMRFMLSWGLAWSGLPEGWLNKTFVVVYLFWCFCVWEYVGCWWELL